MRITSFLMACAATLSASTAFAQDGADCATIRSFDPGWTDITATNGVAGVILDALGYRLQIQTLSVPVGYSAMKSDQIDAFLGNWMPAQAAFIDDLDAAGKVQVLGTNLEGAKFTLAVPKEEATAGIASVADLAAHADAFDRKIYGIEPGAPANQNILKMIDTEGLGLSGWHIVESSEQGMLAQVTRAVRSDKPIVFLAWAPHPMNNDIDIQYLSGADDWFGPDYGGATVRTVARPDWAAQCPNAAAILSNLRFDIQMENDLMGEILDGAAPDEAATAWIKANPERLDDWLKDVTTRDGAPAAAALREALDL
ncbi:choline ABC transporter substrate-binding protein [Falsirhodobacter algicola]|uniref:Choline ABC transporter substrate-binding protein n=1 Tax=Falsirhodobacter algicola TaxID=2692330 RepID=A0A8J8MSD4_9RHOB|nr:choline ABC transporter substrate-binding protein [Falsirhodobacter algicola]QUS35328.1 choline ABC transporter substrate-binding protein [Falsirhodobacter algicola]